MIASAHESGAIVRHAPTASAAPESPGSTTLALLGDAVLVAVYRELEDASWIVRIGSGGARTIVAEVGASPGRDESDGGAVRALAVDDGHGVVWVAGDFGLLALEPNAE